MLFNSYEFLFFFAPLTYFVFYFLGARSQRLAIYWITAASLFFYAWWEPSSLLIILSSVAVNYYLSSLLQKKNITNFVSEKYFILVIGLILNLSLLAYFKYYHFFYNEWNAFWGVANVVQAKTLPLGISFFTFVQIAYLVDSFRKEKMNYSVPEYGFFLTYFPHLIAGPIIHHTDVIPLLKKRETFLLKYENLATGLFLFSMGLFKKTVLADHIAGIVLLIFDSPVGLPISFFEAWMGVFSYTLQIYFDFSAYSDMALGLSKALNITLPANFYSPYKANSIIDFWRRWHMSLSRFLRDYLYIPLGGNRKGRIRRYVNLMLTMILGGFWHGAGWTFIVWGALHGFFLIVNHAWCSISVKKLSPLLARGITFLCVSFAWIFFRANSLHSAIRIIKSMVGFEGISVGKKIVNIFPQLPKSGIATNGFFPNHPEIQNMEIVWIISFLFIVFFLPNSIEILSSHDPASGVSGFEKNNKLGIHWQPNIGWAFVCVVMFLAGLVNLNKGSVFLYFQF